MRANFGKLKHMRQNDVL